MKGLIISQDDELSINFAIALTKQDQVVGDTTAESIRETFGDELKDDTVEEHKAVFRRPSFGDLVRMSGTISTVDGTGFDFNPLAIRLERMKVLLKSWTLGDEDNPVPATAKSVDSLSPVVANIIGVQLDAILGGM